LTKTPKATLAYSGVHSAIFSARDETVGWSQNISDILAIRCVYQLFNHGSALFALPPRI